MDFNDTPQEAAFRQEVADWMAANAPAHVLPEGLHDHHEIAKRGRAWQRRKADAGYGALRLPKAAGGREATAMEEVIFGEEEERFALPVGVYTRIGTGLVVPTLLAAGGPALVERFLRPTLQGELLWCQLFSEPAAGTDLAGLRTRAVRDGDDWVITGQKVWNSYAHVADWGVLVARTDSNVPKHKGLTYFVIDMKAPGVEVRPIRQISGGAEFNEVFLTETRVPDSCRVGPVGAGWKVTMITLMNERVSAGSDWDNVPDSSHLLNAVRQAINPTDSCQIARLVAQEQGLKHYRNRLLTQLSRGETPGAEVAMSKLVYARMLQQLSSTALDLGGLAALYPNAQHAADADRLQHGYCWAAAMRIAGGCDEVLRNQLAERVLGLPADLRVDKDLPFTEIPSGR